MQFWKKSWKRMLSDKITGKGDGLRWHLDKDLTQSAGVYFNMCALPHELAMRVHEFAKMCICANSSIFAKNGTTSSSCLVYLTRLGSLSQNKLKLDHCCPNEGSFSISFLLSPLRVTLPQRNLLIHAKNIQLRNEIRKKLKWKRKT